MVRLQYFVLATLAVFASGCYSEDDRPLFSDSRFEPSLIKGWPPRVSYLDGDGRRLWIDVERNAVLLLDHERKDPNRHTYSFGVAFEGETVTIHDGNGSASRSVSAAPRADTLLFITKDLQVLSKSLNAGSAERLRADVPGTCPDCNWIDVIDNEIWPGIRDETTP